MSALLLLAALASAARGPWLVSLSSAGFEACAQPQREVVCRAFDARPGAETPYEVGGLTGSARALDPSRPLRFVVAGDSGKASPEQWAVARVIERTGAPLWLHTGDVVYPRGRDKDYDAGYFEPYRRLLPRAAVYPAIGNHDYGNHKILRWKGERSFADYARVHRKPAYYSFDAGPAHFVSLDVNRAYGIAAAAEMGPGSPQDLWLREDLARSRARWKLVFLHVPARTTGSHGDHGLILDWLAPLLKEHGVQAVFAGHDHIYERTRPIDGTAFVTVGTGGAGLHQGRRRPVADPFVFRLAAHGVLLVELDEKELRARFLDAEGRERDSFVLEAGARD